ncbi:MAG: DUF1615 family protein [Archangium sp.]
MRTLGVLLCLLMAGCTRRVTPPRLSVDEVAALFPAKVDDRDGWARDLITALDDNKLPVDLEHACSVIAVAEQESGVVANPVVPNLPAIARKALDEKAEKLGPLGDTALEKLLDVKATGATKTFRQRIATLKTEADLDLLFRDLLDEHQRRRPLLYGAADLGARLFSSGSLESHNPVTTAGSMQVSVRFAEERARKLKRAAKDARDALYTRAGGLLYGTARLWNFEADYDSMIFRFADYNAGEFSSRNAAFQEQVSQLAKQSLALDGDLLAYDANGDLKNTDTHTMAAVTEVGGTLHDARKEKSRDFEKTKTWSSIRAAWELEFHRPAPYARMPDVELHSSKLSKTRSTEWFAKSVMRRYESCLKRAK